MFWCSAVFGQIETSKTPATLLAEAKSILKNGGDANDAIAALNELVLLPANELTQEAHELIIEAYERAGKLVKAKIESQLYLSEYPNSQKATQIKHRLLALEIAAPAAAPQDKTKKPEPKTGSTRTFDGSFSEYLVSADGVSTSASSLRMTSTFREDQHTIKGVLRASRRDYFGKNEPAKTTVQQAYIDYEDSFLDRGVRLGTQISSIVSGAFTGVQAKFKVDDEHRVAVVFGTPVTFSASSRKVLGAALEQSFDQRLSMDFRMNVQTVDGFVERKAVSTEIRYFKSDISFSFLAEYDLKYKALNSFLLQSTFPLHESTVYALLDVRRSPYLYAEKAIQLGQNTPLKRSFTRVQELRDTFTDSQIVEFVKASTPTATTLVLGSSHSLTSKLVLYTGVQLFKYSSTSTPAFVDTSETRPTYTQAAQPTSITLDSHLFVASPLSKDSSGILMMSYTSAGKNSNWFMTAVLNEKFHDVHAELVLRMEGRKTTTRSETETVSVRVSKKFAENISIEGQVSTSFLKTFSETPERRRADSMYIGLRYEF
jgi:hypothetical protein